MLLGPGRAKDNLLWDSDLTSLGQSRIDDSRRLPKARSGGAVVGERGRWVWCQRRALFVAPATLRSPCFALLRRAGGRARLSLKAPDCASIMGAGDAEL